MLFRSVSQSRYTGAAEDDLKVLTAKDFVKVLNEDLVSYITDWHEHNLIRADRKIDSIYQNLLLQIVGDVEIVEKRERADRKQPILLEDGTSQGQPKDGIGKVRLGKDSLVNDSKDNKESGRFTPPTLEEVSDYCLERKNGVDPQRFIDYNQSKGWIVGKVKNEGLESCC